MKNTLNVSKLGTEIKDKHFDNRKSCNHQSLVFSALVLRSLCPEATSPPVCHCFLRVILLLRRTMNRHLQEAVEHFV